ncbi:DUF4364 family protein, partial [Ruminococcaceae bacterium OttesenSCG-928-A16]|nr:DUF4364 family protein [Ruminococcaceae bacterium OttesenSCG-928-A16]
RLALAQFGAGPPPPPPCQLEDVLLGQELVNYFVMAESLAQIKQQGLIQGDDDGYTVTEDGRTVGQTLAAELPRTVRDTAVRGVILAQQYAAKQAAHQAEVAPAENGFTVRCRIEDITGPLFAVDLYMPDMLSANAVKEKFIQQGDEVYKLLLAAVTGNRTLADKVLDTLEKQ